MKKKIISIILLVVVLLSAVGFTVYNNFFTTYHYENKDMSKYITLPDTAWTQVDVTSAVLEEVNDTNLMYYIADKLSKTDGKTVLTTGKMEKYDTVNYVYYITMKDENDNDVIISLGTHMDPSKTLEKVQLNADTDLSRLFTELLQDKEITETNYDAYKTGKTYAGDLAFVSFTCTNTATNQVTQGTSVQMDLSDIAALDAVRGTGFGEKLIGQEIGKTFEVDGITNANGESLEYSVTIDFVSRDSVTGGPIMDGDVINISYTYTDADGKVTTSTYQIDGNETAADEAFGAGFSDFVKGLEIGKETTKSINVSGTSYEAKVTVTSVFRQDLSTTDAANITDGFQFLTVDRTYADDAEDTAETDKNIALKGKTVTYHFCPVSFYDANYGFDAIMNTIKYSPDKETERGAYIAAYQEYDQARKAVVESTLDHSSDAYKKLQETEETKRQAMLEKEEAYRNSLEDKPEEVSVDAVTIEAYEEYASEQLAAQFAQEYRDAVAKLVWENLLSVAGNGAQYPARAVRLAYRQLLDSLEATYYTNQTSSPYNTYATFKDYLNQGLYSGKNYENELTTEAQKIVLERMIIHYIADQLGMEVTDEKYEEYLTENTLVSLYVYYGSYTEDDVREAILFEMVMDHILTTCYDVKIDTE